MVKIHKKDVIKQYQSISQTKQKGLNLHKMRKDDLIRLVQKAEGNSACYKGEFSSVCGQTDCKWFDSCKQ